METKPIQINRRSANITEGKSRAPNRSMYYAMGYQEGDFKKPMVGVANGHSTITPCNSGLQKLADAAIEGIEEAGGNAQVLTLDAVLAEPLVIFPRRNVPSLFDAIFALYHAAGHSPQVAQEAIQMQTIVNLVSAGLGVAWVPESVRQFQRPGVVYRALGRQGAGGKGLAVPGCETSLVWREGSPSPSLERFIGFVRETP